MGFQSYWYKTNLPQEFVDIIIKDLKDQKAEDLFRQSELTGGRVDFNKRKSKNAWIETSYWLGGFLWFYIDKINKENFGYDIYGIDSGTIQYTQYEEGEYYNWHVDSASSSLYDLSSERTSLPDEETKQSYFTDFLKTNTQSVRKLSFTLQLSNPDDYEGGEVQFIDDSDELYTLPKERGAIIVFDSRSKHRVRKVKKGVRRSLVGWCVGPPWR